MFCSVFVSLSTGLNEFEFMAKLGDLTECLKRSGRSLTRGDSTVDIKMPFIDFVDTL